MPTAEGRKIVLFGTKSNWSSEAVQETTGLTSCLHLQERCDGLDLSGSGEGGSSARPEGERASGGRSGATQPGKSADPSASSINLVAQQMKTQLATLKLT